MMEKKGELYYAEDDPVIAQAVREYLRERGYAVAVFTEAEGLRQALEVRRPDLLLMDWNLPDGRGDLLCRQARNQYPDLPVIFLTVRGDPDDMVAGFRSGADDYVAKPFDLEVLHARIQALLRRAVRQEEGAVLRCGGLRLDQEKMRVFCGEQEAALSRPEYEILLLLMKNKGRTVTRGQLLEQVWDSGGNYVNDNTLTVTMKRLREKLGRPACLKTVRSFGYRMEDTL